MLGGCLDGAWRAAVCYRIGLLHRGVRSLICRRMEGEMFTAVGCCSAVGLGVLGGCDDGGVPAL